jgi:hypothetical protein
VRVSPVRILDRHVDGCGYLQVVVTVGNPATSEREVVVSGRPLTVAKLLRELADDVERLA